MDVSAILPHDLAAHFEKVLGSAHSLAFAEDWSDLEGAMRRRIVDLLVADPTARDLDTVLVLERIREAFPSLPILIYTRLTPSSFQAVARLARSGVEHVVLYRFDDDPPRFLELIEGIPAQSLGMQMLDELSEELSRLPVALGRAIQRLFRNPGRIRNARDLAEAAGMTARTLYRHLEPVGLYSARSLVVSAQILRVHAYLRDPGRAIKDIAAKTGYRTPWDLNRQMREMTGRSTEQARSDLSGSELVTLLALRVRGMRRKQ